MYPHSYFILFGRSRCGIASKPSLCTDILLVLPAGVDRASVECITCQNMVVAELPDGCFHLLSVADVLVLSVFDVYLYCDSDIYLICQS